MHASSTPVAPGQSKTSAVLRVTAGNFLEQFDFFLFGFYATQIAAVFFPAGSEFASLMMTFAVFGAGFLMRPLGAIILGAYIDDVGRRKGLIVTLSIMASGTILIAFVPGYATLGLVAPALVLIGRLLQGFSAGAELGGVSVYLAEMATPGRKGFFTSWQSASQQVAIVIAAALGFGLNQWLDTAAIAAWGWRVPFFVGCMIVPFIFISAAQPRGDAEFKQRQHRPTHERSLRDARAELECRGRGHAAGRDDHHELLSDHGVRADLRQDGPAPEHRGQSARDAVRGRLEFHLAAHRRRAVRSHRASSAAARR